MSRSYPRPFGARLMKLWLEDEGSPSTSLRTKLLVAVVAWYLEYMPSNLFDLVLSGWKWQPRRPLVIGKYSKVWNLETAGMMLACWKSGTTCTSMLRHVSLTPGTPAWFGLPGKHCLLTILTILGSWKYNAICDVCLCFLYSLKWLVGIFAVLFSSYFGSFGDQCLVRNGRKNPRNGRKITQTGAKWKSVPNEILDFN